MVVLREISLFLLFIFIIFPEDVYSQQEDRTTYNWEVNAGFWTSMFFGEGSDNNNNNNIQDKSFKHDFDLVINSSIRRRLTNTFGARAQFSKGRLCGVRYADDIGFNTKYIDWYIGLDIDIMNIIKNEPSRPYSVCLFVGTGGIRYSTIRFQDILGNNLENKSGMIINT
jgi:hypothetical protein